MSQTSSITGNTSIGKDEFLKLLVTQLKNQDPLSPLQPHEFAAQLAQFTSVEQLTQLNAGLQTEIEGTQLNAMLGKTTFSAALIGRRVIAEGDSVTVPASGAAKVHIEVGAGGGKAKLRLLDAKGHEVATRDLGVLAAGKQNVALPTDLPPGNYHYEITVTGDKSVKVPVTTYTMGTVDGVQFKDGGIVLRIGDAEIPLDSLAEIEPAV